MPKIDLRTSVFDEAVDRMLRLYEQGHRIVVSFSGGKDSTCALEICLIAARETGRLPLEVVMRDEEIMFPGTFEYAERTHARDEIDFTWLTMRQPIVNVFNRAEPYYWVFDPLLDPSEWVRQPPPFTVFVEEDKSIERMNYPRRFPPPEGKKHYAVIGLRVQESRARRMGLHSSKGYVAGPDKHGAHLARPIYDWTDADVWLAIRQNGWDYSDAYDAMYRLGVPRKALRIAPPAMSVESLGSLGPASRAWPQWFDRVCVRLPGLRSAAMFGRRAVQPQRHAGESWRECFQRECVDTAPGWIAERALAAAKHMQERHAAHAKTPFPDAAECRVCTPIRNWQQLAMDLYSGDPFSMRARFLPYVEPEFFRPGAGVWGGKPNF